MAAPDKTLSCLLTPDKLLENIRPGDNIVLQVTDLSYFGAYCLPFVEKALKGNHKVIYFRFADHERILTYTKSIDVIPIDLSRNFEKFTGSIYNEILKQEGDVCYIFDCISDLQRVWATDLMMGNFYKVICPLISSKNSIAYYPLIRGRHSMDSLGRIKNSAQIFLNVYDSIDGSRYSDEETADSWDRFFYKAKMRYKSGNMSKHAMDWMTENILTHDEKLKGLVKKYFSPVDFFNIRENMAGTGRIGGKACGMLLARKIIEHNLPQYAPYIEPHESFFIGADVYYTYIVENNCFPLRLRQRTDEGYFDVEEFREAVKKGFFPDNIKRSFINILNHFGHRPMIVRSSSMLEDGFGNAFAGKYESVFCVNEGTLEERLEKFEEAARTVYLSVLDRSALEYRKQRGLDKKHEQMALLVQGVSGSLKGNYFMPDAAGVGYSYSTYRFTADMDPSVGMLRLVAGLGTRAVDRTGRDYPRLVRLDKPSARLYSNDTDCHKHSQKGIDLLDKKTNELTSKSLYDVLPHMSQEAKTNLLSHDYDAERQFREQGQNQNILYISPDHLLKKTMFPKMMQDILAALEKAYGNPVDVEFAVNFELDSDIFKINILQCRSLSVFRTSDDRIIELPDNLESERVFLHLKKDLMGQSRSERTDLIVYVDPEGYYRTPYNEKPDFKRTIGAVNKYIKENDLSAILIVPGRIGTSSPELGIPVAFSDINYFHGIFEESYSKAGYNPDLSFGSHMFQDLVEDDIFYGAIQEDSNRIAFRPEMLSAYPDILTEIVSAAEISVSDDIKSRILVKDARECPLNFIYDMNSMQVVIYK